MRAICRLGVLAAAAAVCASDWFAYVLPSALYWPVEAIF